MIFVTNELPKFCPECGKGFGELTDYFQGASGQCSACWAQFQYVPADAIITVSKTMESGDLHRYVTDPQV